MAQAILKQWDHLEEVWSSIPIVSTRSFQLGPFSFCLQFSSFLLEEKLTKAFEHLPGREQGEMKIGVWDTTLPQGKLPRLDWDTIEGNGYRGHWDPPFYFHYFETIQALSVFNVEKGRGFYVVRQGEDLPWWVSGSPLQGILHPWLQSENAQLVHTGAISHKGKALLLAGKGGSGKSTTVLSCLREGFDYIGEDYSVIVPGEEPYVLSVYQSAKLAIHTRSLFPEYERFVVNCKEAAKEKGLIYYGEIFPDQILLSSPLCAVVSLEVGEETVLKQGSLHQSLKSLLMSTVAQLPFGHEKTLPLLKQALCFAQHYHLTLGPDRKKNVEVIRSLF